MATMESGRVPSWRSAPTEASSTHSPKFGKEQLCIVFANVASTQNRLCSEKKSQRAISRYGDSALSSPFGSELVRSFRSGKAVQLKTIRLLLSTFSNHGGTVRYALIKGKVDQMAALCEHGAGIEAFAA